MIELNGKKVEWEEGLTVEALIERMNFTFPGIIVRVDGEYIPKKNWPHFVIKKNSKVRAHHLIAGG